MTFPACSDRTRVKRATAVGALLLACALTRAAWAVEPFVVRDIRVEGVQRTEAGTIFSYLPIKVGDRVTDEKISDAVKALYATGFFRDVRLEAQGDVLVVAVQERPTISTSPCASSRTSRKKPVAYSAFTASEILSSVTRSPTLIGR